LILIAGNFLKKILALFCISLMTTVVSSQSIPIGQLVSESELRTMQLSGQIKVDFSSFTIRPIVSNDSINLNRVLHLIDSNFKFPPNNNSIKLLPISWNDQV
jgi:hypothetical protein